MDIEARWKALSREPPELLTKMQAVWDGRVNHKDPEQQYLQKMKLEDPKWFLGQWNALERDYQGQLKEALKEEAEQERKGRLIAEERVKELEARLAEVEPQEVDEGTGRALDLLDRLREVYQREKAEREARGG